MSSTLISCTKAATLALISLAYGVRLTCLRGTCQVNPASCVDTKQKKRNMVIWNAMNITLFIWDDILLEMVILLAV